MTYTYAILEVTRKTYDEIYKKLKAAGCSDQIDGDGTLDMHGIALAEEDGVYDRGGSLEDGKI
jgi:hypothetical protein